MVFAYLFFKIQAKALVSKRNRNHDGKLRFINIIDEKSTQIFSFLF
jgi:hypothetical protein